MYFTSGGDRAFESLMQGKPGFDHYDSGDAGAPEDCGDCRFYRPDWKYQFCVYAECPYQPGKLTALDAVKFQVKGVDDEMAVFRVEKNRGYTVMSNHHLRNKDLSLKAKGLLSQMLSLPENWDYINLLCDRADDKYGGRLPVHVRMILDEFANIGQIPNFDKLIATIRSREISASIILQSQSQLKAIYKDAAEIISDNCDCTLFLSGRGKNAKEIADVLGKETIDSFNQSENRGAQTSHGLNYQKLGKDMPYLLVKSSTALNLT